MPAQAQQQRFQYLVGLPAALFVAALSACNAPKYEGMPIDEFIQVTKTEDAAIQEAESTHEIVPATQPAVRSEAYRIGPADLLTVTISDLDVLGAPTVLPVRVSGQGEVTLPLVGAVSVANRTLVEAEQAITTAYQPKYIRQPRVFVEVKEYHTTDVLVIDNLHGATDVNLRSNERTVFHAIARTTTAGDTEAGKLVMVQPASDPNRLELYDLSRPQDMAQAMNRPPLEEGDIVIVRPRPQPLIYIHGLTGSGPYPLPETGLTLRQAVAAAGGPPTAFDADKVVLTRRLHDGRDACVVFKWKKVVDGEQPNVTLRPGDVIEIPHTPETRVEEFVRNALVLRAGVSAVYDPIQQHWPPKVRFDDYNDNYSLRRLILSDVALRGTRRITAPLLGP